MTTTSGDKAGKRRCIVCRKVLKVFETNLCSCNENLCMNHRNKDLHKCVTDKKVILPPKITAAKVSRI